MKPNDHANDLAASNSATVQNYFAQLNQKGDWESFISEDVGFNSPGGHANGKDAYLTATRRFLQVVQSVKIRQLIVEGNHSSTIARYELLSPKGHASVCEVAEIFELKNGKIQSSSIFLDTAAFREFLTKG